MPKLVHHDIEKYKNEEYEFWRVPFEQTVYHKKMLKISKCTRPVKKTQKWLRIFHITGKQLQGN